MNMCKYTHALGVPNEGVHSYRLFGIAIVDFLMTIIIAAVVSFLSNISFMRISIGFFLTGILLHRVFCVDTAIDRWLKRNLM